MKWSPAPLIERHRVKDDMTHELGLADHSSGLDLSSSVKCQDRVHYIFPADVRDHVPPCED